MNVKKYIKLNLNEDGTCTEIEGFGYPVAGESGAFFVEFVYPAAYAEYSKTAMVAFDGVKSELSCVEGVTGVFLPTDVNKGGVVCVTAIAARKSAEGENGERTEIIKWKPYYISVLDAPVATGLQFENEVTLLDSVKIDVDALKRDTVKKSDVEYIPQTFTEKYDLDTKERYLKIGCLPVNDEDFSNIDLKLNAVSDEHSGDMTPDMLKRLNNAVLKKDLSSGLVSSMSVEGWADSVNLILGKTDFGGETVKTEYVNLTLPMASSETSGFMSAADKIKIDKAATLDESGRVPAEQLPSYVDDVLEFGGFSVLPSVGETGKIYITTDTNKTYRWSGSRYVEISTSLALGETFETAYRGDRGKIAYDHSQAQGNPHNTTKADIGLDNVANERQYSAQNMQPYPLGFASGQSELSWGVSAGSPLRVWNDAEGGAIGFRKNCPQQGKLSVVVNGKVYVDDGQKELAALNSPVFTGNPQTPTPSLQSNDMSVANTSWVNSVLREKTQPSLYRHRITLSGNISGVSEVNARGCIEIYTTSGARLTTASAVAAAYGISSGVSSSVPACGCGASGGAHTVLCTEAVVNSDGITLRGLYFGYSAGNGVIDLVSAVVSSISDEVTLVS